MFEHCPLHDPVQRPGEAGCRHVTSASRGLASGRPPGAGLRSVAPRTRGHDQYKGRPHCIANTQPVKTVGDLNQHLVLRYSFKT